MRTQRVLFIWSAGGLAGGVLAATVWAQAPVPPTGPAFGPHVVREEGPVRRAVAHTWHALQNNFVGYPPEFIEPPPGFYLYESLGVMRSKANPHRFTLYRSDFLDGTSRLSPLGASRFNVMAARLRSWPGPVVVEWSPDQPGLAESRRAAVLALLQGSGAPVIPERVVIGPSPYPGLLGTDAANNYSNMINRFQSAPAAYSLPPSTTGGSFSGGTP